MSEKKIFEVKHEGRKADCDLGRCLCVVLKNIAEVLGASADLVAEKAKTVKLLNVQLERQVKKGEPCNDGYKGSCDDRCQTHGCKKERKNCADVACDSHCDEHGCKKHRDC